MKIFFNTIMAVLWLVLLTTGVFGHNPEMRANDLTGAFIVICIFCAKELIIYEIEKLKTPSGSKGDVSNSTGEK